MTNAQLLYIYKLHYTTTSFEPDVVLCSVSVIPLQHICCFVYMFFVRAGSL